MATPDIVLANQALRLLASEGIASLDEGTDVANTVAQLYGTTIRQLLAAHPWRFTLRKQQLSRLAEPPLTEWQHLHALPADMLALRALYPTAAPGAETVRRYELFERRVASNHLDLWADYQFEPDAGTFPPYFVALARAALAAEFAIPLGVGAERADLFHRRAYGSPAEAMAGGLMREARRLDSQQQPPQRITDFPLISARFGGRPAFDG
jgi:hypothetical protein